MATNPSELRARRAALKNSVAETDGDGSADRTASPPTAAPSDPPSGRTATVTEPAAAPRPKDGRVQTTVIEVDHATGTTPATRRRVEARKVRRLIRHVDPWSVAKAAILFFLSFWFIVMIAAVIVWTVAQGSGTVEKIETFIESNVTQEEFRLDGDFLFRQFGLVTLVLALGGALATTIASVIFNLISDIIGGVWVTVIEAESLRRRRS